MESNAPSTFDVKQYPFEGAQRIRLLGEGTYGSVGLYQLTSGVMVAIKGIYNEEEYDYVGLDPRIVLEISILQSLRGCDNLVQLLNLDVDFDIDIQTAEVSLMMPSYTSDLKQFITLVPLSERLKYANQVVDQLLNGLFQMYHRGILHRDIHSMNIFVDYNYDQTNQRLIELPQCYYGDFGLATQLACNPDDRHDSMDVMAYTVAFRPPEIMVGRTDYTDKADLWAVGVTLVDYFSGEIIFSFQDDVDDDDAINIVLPELLIPPPIDQYDEYRAQIQQNTVHNRVDVSRFLVDQMGLAQYKRIPKKIRTLLTQLLQINPDDRPSITTLVTNQAVCPYPPTLLARGPLYRSGGTTTEMYSALVDWLIGVATLKQLRPKTLIVCIDMLDRYLAHYDPSEKGVNLLLIGSILLIIAASMVEVSIPIKINVLIDYADQTFTADQFRAKELELIRQLNYTFLSCEIDQYVDHVERQPMELATKYDQLRQMYETIESRGIYAGDLSYDQIISYF